MGGDELSEFGIDIKFSNQTVVWNNLPTIEEYFHVEDSESLKADTDCLKQILEAKY